MDGGGGRTASARLRLFPSSSPSQLVDFPSISSTAQKCHFQWALIQQTLSLSSSSSSFAHRYMQMILLFTIRSFYRYLSLSHFLFNFSFSSPSHSSRAFMYEAPFLPCLHFLRTHSSSPRLFPPLPISPSHTPTPQSDVFLPSFLSPSPTSLP